MIGLALIAALFGVGSVFVYKRVTDLTRVGATVKKLLAHLMELQLYANEPALIWRAQLAAFRESGRLFWLLFPATLLLALPTILILWQMNAVFEHTPLTVGQAAIVTAHLRSGTAAELETPPGIVADAQVHAQQEISWRVRPARALHGELICNAGGTAVTKSIVSGPGLLWASATSRFSAGAVDSITVNYPASGFHWLGWFALFSTLGALVAAWRW